SRRAPPTATGPKPAPGSAGPYPPAPARPERAGRCPSAEPSNPNAESRVAVVPQHAGRPPDSELGFKRNRGAGATRGRNPVLPPPVAPARPGSVGPNHDNHDPERDRDVARPTLAGRPADGPGGGVEGPPSRPRLYGCPDRRHRLVPAPRRGNPG